MHCGSKVIIFIENLTDFFIPKSGRKYSYTNSYNFAMTLISQDDNPTAGAWAACGIIYHTSPHFPLSVFLGSYRMLSKSKIQDSLLFFSAAVFL